jgi:hypothetical protein
MIDSIRSGKTAKLSLTPHCLPRFGLQPCSFSYYSMHLPGVASFAHGHARFIFASVGAGHES